MILRHLLFQVTSALDESLAPGQPKLGLTNGRARVDEDSSDDESDNDEGTKDKHDVMNRSTLTSPLQQLSIKQSMMRKESIKEENADTEHENDERQETRISSRPRRSAGRSLFERKPDFALGTEFAKILRQRTMKEKSRIKKLRKQFLESSKDNAEEGVGWRSAKFRQDQLSRLDSALASSGWSSAIKSGKNMENEVFKQSQTEAAYIAGIDQLVMHFQKGNNSSKVADDLKQSQVKSKRVSKPSRKILDGLDFRRKVVSVKVACSKCGLKIIKSKLKSHMDSEHPRVQVKNKERELESDNEDLQKLLKVKEKLVNNLEGIEPEPEDAGSEFSVVSVITNSSTRSQRNRKKALPSVPENEQETEMAEKVRGSDTIHQALTNFMI